MANLISMFLPHFFKQLDEETVSPIPEPKLAPSDATMQTYERAANVLADQLDRVENEIKRLEILKNELSISYDSILVAAKALTNAKHPEVDPAKQMQASLEADIAEIMNARPAEVKV